MEAIREPLSNRAKRLKATWDGLSTRAQGTVLILAVAAVALGGVGWGRAMSDDTALRVVRGEVRWVALDGVVVAVADHEDVFYVGTGAGWTGVDGISHEPSQPECLPPDSYGAVVELSVQPEIEGTYPNQVAWVRCVTLPTDFRNDDVVIPCPLDDAYQQALEREG